MQERAQGEAAVLLNELARLRLPVARAAGQPDWELAVFNGPGTPTFMRRNEVMVKLQITPEDIVG